MLYDRPYMRDRNPIYSKDYFWWSFWVVVGSFLLQNLLGVWFGLRGEVFDWLALSPANMGDGKVWTIFTYSLLHGSLGHFFFNVLALFFIGKWLSRQLEPRRYLHLIFATVFIGGLVWLTLHSVLGPPEMKAVPVVGFSAAVVGMLVVACLMWPGERITLLLFFVLPLEMKPRTLLWIVLGIEILGFSFMEFPRLVGVEPMLGESGVAFSAHLGGALGGYLFFRFLQRPEPIFRAKRSKVSIEPPQWLKKKSSAASVGKFKVNVSNRKDLKREVDRILDKINREGFGALSDEEKRVLDQAGELLRK